MRKFLALFIGIITTFSSFSQALGYDGLALKFSKDNQYGTARFTAMSGAFGAIGGDISAINVNPAGLAVLKYSESSLTFNSRNTETTSTYYGNSLSNSDNFFNLSQIGTVLVYDLFSQDDWSKVAIGVNYRMTTDFENSFSASGNNGLATFTNYPLDFGTTPIEYTNAENQYLRNIYRGNTIELNIGISAKYQDNLYVGFGINTYELDFFQGITLQERNNDGNGNTLRANFYQENTTKGYGFSLNLGGIYKLTKNVRFGVSYQTPNWYTELLEFTNINEKDGYFGATSIDVSNDKKTTYENGNTFTPNFFYRLSTPSKITASVAYVFGKRGLINIDYTRKGYKGVGLSNADFSVEDAFFANNIRNTNSINAGTEWRFGRTSLRAGYRFEQSPDKYAVDSDNLTGYSFGAGYNFGNARFDFSFSDHKQTGVYNFYPKYNTVNSTELSFNNKTMTFTLTYNL